MKAVVAVGVLLLFVHSAPSWDHSCTYCPRIIQIYGNENLRGATKIPLRGVRKRSPNCATATGMTTVASRL